MRYTGTIYKTDGTIQDFDIPEQGSLEAFQGMVGGYIERVPLIRNDNEPINHDMLVNEEGLLEGLLANPFAYLLTYNTNFRDRMLVGNIVIVNGGLKECDEEDDYEDDYVGAGRENDDENIPEHRSL